MPRARRRSGRLLAAVLALVAAGGSPREARADAPFLAPAPLVVIAARVDGQAVRLLLDTGDPGGLLLYDAAAGRLGLEPGAPVRGTGRGLFGAANMIRRPLRVARLAVDAATWADLDAAVIPAEPELARAVGAEFDGILGAALLDGRLLVLDYRRRRLAIADPVAAAPAREAERSAMHAAPLRLIEGRLVTTVELSGSPRSALIDTASAATLIDGTALGNAPTGAAVGVVDAAGHAAGLPAARMTRLSAGGSRFKEVAVLAADLGTVLASPPHGDAAPLALVLGADLLARGRVTLDLGAGRFVLEPGR